MVLSISLYPESPFVSYNIGRSKTEYIKLGKSQKSNAHFESGVLTHCQQTVGVCHVISTILHVSRRKNDCEVIEFCAYLRFGIDSSLYTYFLFIVKYSFCSSPGLLDRNFPAGVKKSISLVKMAKNDDLR